MGWVQRNTGRYFYLSDRVAGRSRCRYFGTGPAAELVAAVVELRRVQKAVARRERLTEQERLAVATAPLLELCDLTDTLARAALVAAGFHQHDRGAWRRQRERIENPTDD